MKKLFVVLLVFGLIVSCHTKTEADQAQTNEAQDIKKTTGVAYKVQETESTVEWIGTKPTGEHTGTVKMAGEVFIENSQVVGGIITFDLQSIVCSDLDGDMKTKLETHLKSPDFFDVANFPTASFKITNVTVLEGQSSSSEDIIASHNVTGNLTIRNITKSVTFGALLSVESDIVVVITPKFSINRTLWGVNFKSKTIFAEFKDNFINDKIILSLYVKAAK